MSKVKKIWRNIWGGFLGRFAFTRKTFYVIRLPFLKIKANRVFKKYGKLHVMSTEDTIKKIVDEELSVTRFGDGEYRWMLGVSDVNMPPFQKTSPELARDLKEVILHPLDNCLVCAPIWLSGSQKAQISRHYFWANFVSKYYAQIIPFLDLNYNYGNTVWTDVNTAHIPIEKKRAIMKDITRIWDNKHILVVEGKHAKTGVNSTVFDNAKKISRIIAPSENAYEKYDEIMAKIKKYKKTDDLMVIIMLGPTATIIAYNLAKDGYRAIDMGHVNEFYLSVMPEISPEELAEKEQKYKREIFATVE